VRRVDFPVLLRFAVLFAVMAASTLGAVFAFLLGLGVLAELLS
jgi:hypothetical protein